MKAVVFEKDRVLRVQMRETPACQADEALVKVHSLGVCGTDLAIFQGYHNHRVRYPMIPGHEWSGEVIRVGEAVTAFRAGDRVVGEVTLPCGTCKICKQGKYNICPKRVENGVFGRDGAGAEYMAVPASNLHRIPDHLSFDEACLIEPTAVAFRGVDRARVTPHDHVAVFGAGPIGLLAVSVAKSFGAKTITSIDLRENRLRKAVELGATHTIDISQENGFEKAREITNGDLFNVIIEASGSMAALKTVFEVPAQGARISMIGTFHGQPTIDGNAVVRKDLEVYGSVASPNVWETVIHLVETGKVPVKNIITHYFPLDDYGDALRLMEEKDMSIIKAIIKP